MTERAVDRDRLFEALVALRDASDPSSAELAWAWRAVDAWVDRRHRRPEREHDDVRQRTLMKVMRGVGGMQADTAAGAAGWIRRVHDSAVYEHHRGHDPVAVGLKHERRDDRGRGVIDRIAAPAPDRSAEDRQRIDAAIAAVLERVERWLEDNVTRASKRIGDRRRAECALMANVLGHEPDAIAEAMEVEVSRSALYKWIERGREEVLLPTLAAWAQDGDDPEGARLAEALREILEGARRSDAGKPRPGRRSVSRRGGGSSTPSKRPKGPRGS